MPVMSFVRVVCLTGGNWYDQEGLQAYLQFLRKCMSPLPEAIVGIFAPLAHRQGPLLKGNEEGY